MNLEARLLAAHAQGRSYDLVALYTEAADQANTQEAKGFYLTHAYVFALELDHPQAPNLHAALVEMGREE